MCANATLDRLEARYRDLQAQGQPGWYDSAAAADSLARWHRTLGPLLADLGGHGLIAEFGSGAGDVAISLSSLGFWVVGFEISSSAVDWATQKADRRGSTAQFEVRDLGEPMDLFNSYMGACDLVVDGDCYHYVHGDRRKIFLHNAHSLLSKDGAFVLRTIVGQPPQEMWETLGYNPDTRTSQHEGIPMTYFAEIDEVLEEIREAGFTIESQEFRHVDPWRGSDVLTVIARR